MADSLIFSKQTSGRIPQIELLRAIAMVAIFVFHLWSVVPGVTENGTAGYIVGTVSSFGYLGVVFFNFITGFVLAFPYLGPQQRAVPGFGYFLRRRFLRICPKYYFTLTLWSSVLLFSGSPENSALLSAFVAHLTFTHSLFTTTFFAIVPAYWWLGLLAQFYLVFPVVLRLFKALGAGKACLLICLGCWGLWMVLTLLSQPGSVWAMVNYMVYYNLPARLPEFAIGMWLAESWQSEPAADAAPQSAQLSAVKQRFLWLVIPALVFAIGSGTILHVQKLCFYHLSMVCWCFAVFVALLVMKPSFRLGQCFVVTKIAAASYSIYLLHQPLLGYAHDALRGSLQPLSEYTLLLLVIGAASFAFAEVLDRVVI